MVEHGVLTRVLIAYRTVSESLSSSRQVPSGVVLDAAQLIADVVEGFHEGLEEAYVFPRVATQHADLVRTLLIQHDRGRHLTADILTLAGNDVNTPAFSRPLITRLTAFARMYQPHEAWEDTVIYPALRSLTSQRELDLLAERFADLLARQYGDSALAQILERLAGIEEQLGIGDLATFTPQTG